MKERKKNHEEQICNSTEQFLILKTLTAITCSKVLHQLRDLGEKKKMPISFSVFGQLSYSHHMCSSHSETTGKSKLCLEISSSKSAPQLLYWAKQISPYVFSTQGLGVSLPHFLILQIVRPS